MPNKSDESASEEEKTKGKRIVQRKKQPSRNAKKPKVDSDDDASDGEFEPAAKTKAPKKKPAKTSKKKKADADDEEEASETATPQSGESIKPITDDDSKYLKIISWNVASLRSIIKKGLFQEYLNAEKPDIIFIQETKMNSESELNGYKPEGYTLYWNFCKSKKGYSGTACFTKIKPLNVTYDIGVDEFDQEGRTITLEMADYYLIGTYIPNAGEGLKRLKYRQLWDEAFLAYLKALDAKKPLIWTGDLNVAHHEIDIKNPNVKLAGFTPEERNGFSRVLEAGFVDSWRKLNPGVVQYTYWNFRTPRSKNVGWRLDYFVTSERLFGKIVNAFVRQSVLGSDHCPIGLLLPRPVAP